MGDKWVLNCLPAFAFGYHSYFFEEESRRFCKILRQTYREIRILKYVYFKVDQYFCIQEKEDDTQDRIDQGQTRLEETLLMMESTLPRDNRDIPDVTIFAKNLAAEVSY